jgi:hypothetical protein
VRRALPSFGCGWRSRIWRGTGGEESACSVYNLAKL